MSIRYDFRNPKKLAEFVVGKSILESMAEEKRKNIIKRVAFVMNNYRGSELLVGDILSGSAEKGKLEKYLGKLEMHRYQRHASYLGRLIRLSVCEL
mgnify:CR=1 FL=1